jgi:hypothetical protein
MRFGPAPVTRIARRGVEIIVVTPKLAEILYLKVARGNTDSVWTAPTFTIEGGGRRTGMPTCFSAFETDRGRASLRVPRFFFRPLFLLFRHKRLRFILGILDRKNRDDGTAKISHPGRTSWPRRGPQRRGRLVSGWNGSIGRSFPKAGFPMNLGCLPGLGP